MVNIMTTFGFQKKSEIIHPKPSIFHNICQCCCCALFCWVKSWFSSGSILFTPKYFRVDSLGRFGCQRRNPQERDSNRPKHNKAIITYDNFYGAIIHPCSIFNSGLIELQVILRHGGALTFQTFDGMGLHAYAGLVNLSWQNCSLGLKFEDLI